MIYETSQQSFPLDIGGALLAVVAVVNKDVPQCAALMVLLEEEMSRFPDVRFFQLDPEKSPFLSAQLNITALPTLIGWRQGAVQWTLVGVHQAQEIQQKLQQLRD